MTTMRDPGTSMVPEWELCDRLTRSLRLINLSQAEIADHLGYRRETVSRWINGRNRPQPAVLRLWADMTGVDYRWLKDGYAIADSNREPADMKPAVVLRLVPRATPVRPTLTRNAASGARRLMLVPA